MSVQSEMLGGLSLAALAAVYNAAISNHALDAKPVAKFSTKGLGIAKILNIANTNGLEIAGTADEPFVAVIAIEPKPEDAPEDDAPLDPHSAEAELDGEIRHIEGHGPRDEDPDAPEGSRDEEPEAAPAAFVRLSKEELPAKGTPEREAYRKGRRAAARAARMSKG